MIFHDSLVLVKKEVEKELVEFFVTKKNEAKKLNPHCLPLVEQVESITTRGGKRTRAFLCWLGFQAVSGQLSAVSSKLLHAMMALELFQSFALIHDDIIDEDTVRRGGKTVHEYFKSEVLSSKSKVKNAEHFGTSMAILAGDLALVWADELMGRVKSEKSPPKADQPLAEKVKSVYQRMKEEVIFGQSLDVMEKHMKPGIPKELIDTYKTAWYTVIRPLQIGACIAGADQTVLDGLASYGLIAGRAYQLRDDTLDGAVSQAVFEETANKYERDMHGIIALWHQEKVAMQLFIDFFHFALTRPL